MWNIVNRPVNTNGVNDDDRKIKTKKKAQKDKIHTSISVQ